MTNPIHSFVLLMEIVGPKKREMVAILYQIPFNIGHASLALFAYFIREWRWFQFSITIFSIVFVIYIWLVPESPRWLFTTGKLDKSIKILEKIAKCNKAPTETIRPEIEAAYGALAARQPVKKGTVVDLFRTPYMRIKTIFMANNWLVVCMVYYGTAQYVSALGGNIFISNAIAAGVGIPGTCLCALMTQEDPASFQWMQCFGLNPIGMPFYSGRGCACDLRHNWTFWRINHLSECLLVRRRALSHGCAFQWGWSLLDGRSNRFHCCSAHRRSGCIRSVGGAPDLWNFLHSGNARHNFLAGDTWNSTAGNPGGRRDIRA